ncbi:TPA: FRG domain-containing protein [Citrobacter farmeri]|uniref:FRG domain-containing protein n=1 Tax=Citrobacter farmeri TaxID=67824 RepID=UPI00050FA193|nr:FRG domain-containing protein [Citrobacter farmeri]EKW5058782.1 FRG domain-containing protein [Citrobacter amalonaticus]QXA96759.1 FRG domain-containing protein [Citrobacter farmeri]GAL51556.1 hypothetical protein CIFAM_19_02100 [Citrobacter farmeri GTC 1319]
MSTLTIINCNTAKEFLNQLTPWSTPYDLNNYVYRGHSDEEYLLHPNIMRKTNNLALIKIAKMYIVSGEYKEIINKVGVTNISLFHNTIELTILRRFYRSANENGLYVPISDIMSKQMEIDGYIGFDELMKEYGHDKWLNKDSFEIAALAQHYGLPTRLIDWSFNQYVASFFATNFTSKPDNSKKISLWMLNYNKLSKLFASPHSDVRIFSPHYQWNENAKSQKGLFTYIESTLKENEFSMVCDYLNACKETDSLISDHTFDSLRTDYRTLDIALDNAISNYNKNDGKIDTKDILIKLTLPCSEAIKVNKYLREIKISEATIFPGYSGVVEDLKSVLRF